LPLVSALLRGPFDADRVPELAERRETVCGLVVRAVVERYSPSLRRRAIAKTVGDGCLTRKGGTEYEEEVGSGRASPLSLRRGRRACAAEVA
jgi:hypothetical protein